MKIICIGRNYADHAKELKNEVPKEPVFFLKPDSALLQKSKIFFYPEFTKDLHYEVELVVKINKVGKHIEEKFAHKYYDEIGLGIDFTARDIQQQCKEKGLPWEKAKAFDQSAVLSKKFIEKSTLDLHNINFSLKLNDTPVQEGNSSNMLFNIDQIIAYVSQFLTLKKGDLIYTGTPAGVGPVKLNDELTGFIGDQQMFGIKIK